MASWLEDQLFEIRGQGPPPPKDFFQLVITKTELIWSTWKISLRLEARGAPPRQLKIPHCNFLRDKMLQYDVGAVFGQRILEYSRLLCQGNIDYLERLSDDILLTILSHLRLKETTVLALVSRRFRKLCNSEKFWEHTVRNRCAEFASDMEDIANTMGWRRTFFTFFHVSGTKEQQ